METKQNLTLEDIEKYLCGEKSAEDLAAISSTEMKTDHIVLQDQQNKENSQDFLRYQKVIMDLAQNVKRYEEEVQNNLQKIEELDASVRSLRNALHEMKSEASQPSSRVSEMLREQDARFEEKIGELKEKLREIEAQRVPAEKPTVLNDDEFENLNTSKEVQNDDEFEPLKADEEEVVDDAKYGTYPPDDIADMADDELKPKKKGSALKKILIFMLLGIVTMVALVGYVKVKQGSGDSMFSASDMIDPMAAQPAPNTPAPVPTAAPMAGKAATSSTIDPLAVEAEKQKAQQQKKTASVSKHVAAGKQVSRNKDVDQRAVPAYPPIASVEIDPLETERSPIEDELLQNHKQVKDIAFRCRLKAKYPAGEYIYYNKQGDKYTVNPKEDAVLIGEKNVIYNYSPENKFVKVGDNKYLKTKLFANCKAIVPTR